MSIEFTFQGKTHKVRSCKDASRILFSQEWINDHAHRDRGERGAAVDTVILNAAVVNSDAVVSSLELMQGICIYIYIYLYLYLYYNLQLISHSLGIKTATMTRMGSRRAYILQEEKKGESMGQQLLQQKEQLEEQAAAQILELRRQHEEQAAAQILELRRQLEEQPDKKRMRAGEPETRELTFTSPPPLPPLQELALRPPPPPRLTLTPVPRSSTKAFVGSVPRSSTTAFVGSFNGTTLFQLRTNGDVTIVPNILNSRQFYSGVLMLDTIVVKFITRPGGARFRLGDKADQEQRDYYTEKRKAFPTWIGYSEEVQSHKVDDEVVAMRLVHDELSALGPAIYDVATFSGTKV